MEHTDPDPLREEVRTLRRAVEELALLNDLAIAMGSARDLDTVIRTLVRRSLGVVDAEQGVVTLVDRRDAGDAATLVRTAVTGSGAAYRPDQALLGLMGTRRRALVLNDAHAPTSPVPFDAGVRSVLCVPLVAHGRFLGVLSLTNKRTGGFSDDDVRLLTILGMQSAQVVEAAQVEADRDRVLGLFGRHTHPAVVEELLKHEADPPSRRVQACVMFLDVRGFTAFSERAEPEAVVDYLNALFAITTDAVTSRGGIIHQLLGDGFMAIFGAPLSTPDDCARAVEASLDIAARVEAEVEAARLLPTTVGIGLHAGEVVAGTVGSPQHKEYKVTGDVVNVAARVEGLNKAFDSRVLATAAVVDRLPPDRFEAEPLGEVTLRGRGDSPALFRIA
jgi:class 3 adenylate cyclase